MSDGGEGWKVIDGRRWPFYGVRRLGVGSWRAELVFKGELRCLGTYVSPLDAAAAYDDEALRLLGSMAATNFDYGANPPVPVNARVAQLRRAGGELDAVAKKLLGDGVDSRDLRDLVDGLADRLRRGVLTAVAKPVLTEAESEELHALRREFHGLSLALP